MQVMHSATPTSLSKRSLVLPEVQPDQTHSVFYPRQPSSKGPTQCTDWSDQLRCDSQLIARNAIDSADKLKTNSRVASAVPTVTSSIGLCADWIIAVTAPSVLFFSIAVNVYYLLAFGNNVQITVPDIYGGQKEWLLEPGSYGNLDENLMYAFISSTNPQASLNLTNALQTKPDPAAFQPDGPCVAMMGRDGGSLYALCDQLDQRRLPTWAAGFKALTIQSAYLSSAEEFYNQVAKSYAAAYQAFPNERKGWFEQATIKRLTCTTQELVQPVTGFQSRLLYTGEFGVLTQVDCSKSEYSITKECHAVAQNPRIQLFDDQSESPPFIDTYHVFESVSGTLLILHPFPSKDSIGQYTTKDSSWPVDCCLYIRDGVLGWFGVGYTVYTVQIPTIALIAKIELIVVISIIWLVHYRLDLRYAHHSLYSVSRMGVFGVLVLQIVVSAYMEQDIMRTIFSWTRNSGEIWLLYFYVLCDVSMSVSLVALLWLRIVLEGALCTVGCILSMTVGFLAALSETVIARIRYSEYTIENGLLPVPSISCVRGFTGCSSTKFNLLHFVFVWVVVPVAVELVRVNRLRIRRCRVVVGPEILAAHLTTFERKCLDETSVVYIVRDLLEPRAASNKRRQIHANVVGACGFTIIHNRFLIRTKDVWLLVLAEFTPLHKTRDVSTIVWPLQLNGEGLYQVRDSKRVYISGIRRIHLHKKHNASLIHGTHHSLV